MGISYNKAILVGRLTADPQISYSTNGLMIAKFTLAVDRQYRGNNQQGGQETDFIRTVAFGKTAEFASNYLGKGRLIMVEGHIQVSKFVGQDGNNKYSTDIIAENIRFMETKKGSGIDNRPFDGHMTNTDEVFDAPGETGEDEVPF